MIVETAAYDIFSNEYNVLPHKNPIPTDEPRLCIIGCLPEWISALIQIQLQPATRRACRARGSIPCQEWFITSIHNFEAHIYIHQLFCIGLTFIIYIKVVLRALPWPTRMPWIRSRISIRAFACKKNLWIELAAGFIYRWWFWRSPAYRVPPPYTNIWGDEQKIVHDYLSLTYLFSAVPSCKLSSELI